MNALVPSVEKTITKVKRVKPKKQTKVLDLRNAQRAQFKLIEPIPKYIETIQITQFSTDLPIAIINGKIHAGLPVLNTVKKYSHVEVHTEGKSSITIGYAQDSRETDYLPKALIKERLLSYGDSELIAWLSLLETKQEHRKTFYRDYLQCLLTREPTIKENIKNLRKGTQDFRRALYNKYPVHVMRWIMDKNLESRLGGVIVNDRFLELVGYTTEEFTTKLLAEGVPEFTSMDNPIVVQKTRSLMCTNYDFRLDRTPKFNYQTDLYTKDGVVLESDIDLYLVAEAHEEFMIYDVVCVVRSSQVGKFFCPFSNWKLNPEFAKTQEMREKEWNAFNAKDFKAKLEFPDSASTMSSECSSRLGRN